MTEIEIELTYLAASLPPDLDQYPVVDILDLYIPASDAHPSLRMRKKGDQVKLCAKRQVPGQDASQHSEQTIDLLSTEFEAISSLPSKKVHKLRYRYPYLKHTAEIDIFLDDLAGLVLVDFEFDNPSDCDSFTPPDFCLVDVTSEEFIAGGKLAGKSYADIEEDLARFDYQPISL